ncbi:MAG: hypothetical protein J6Y69_06420 [Treponema sp.]|nr:hypothetical protein [Treponema sp.]
MKIFRGKLLSIFIVIFCSNFLYCEDLSIENFYGEYEYCYFVALHKINENRINFLVEREFNKLILSQEKFTAGLYKYDRPYFRIVLPNEDAVVNLNNKTKNNRSYTCSYFIDLLTENRKYKDVIVVNDSCVVEIIDDDTLAFHSENGWFVYKRK